MPEAGWYPDPDDSNWVRRWDGENWTSQRRPAPSGGSDRLPPILPPAATTPPAPPAPEPSPAPTAPEWPPAPGSTLPPSASSTLASPPTPPASPSDHPGGSVPPSARAAPTSPGGYPPPPPPFFPPGQLSESGTGFFKSLFDFSFSSLITTKIIKVVYIIITIFVSFFAVIGVIVSLFLMTRSVFLGLIDLIITPLIWLIYMIMARIFLEAMIVIFRIGEDVRTIARR